MKKYKTWEVIKMLTENPKLQFKGEYGEVLKIKQIFKSDYLNYSSKTEKMYLNYDWELIEQSVTFEEVLNSSKRCKVEHEILTKLKEDFPNNIYLMVVSEFNDLDECIHSLSQSLDSEQLKEVIKNGEWYLE